jgi:hypothetical protein
LRETQGLRKRLAHARQFFRDLAGRPQKAGQTGRLGTTGFSLEPVGLEAEAWFWRSRVSQQPLFCQAPCCGFHSLLSLTLALRVRSSISWALVGSFAGSFVGKKGEKCRFMRHKQR